MDELSLVDQTPPTSRPPPPPLPPPVAPTLESQRVDSIDVLRGFALLGILILNIQAFAMPGAAYMNPHAYGDLTGTNYWVWYLSQLLAEQKFMTIFSLLFGAGIVLMTSRIEATGRSSASLHYRRMGWLILFGLLHAHLLWYGDILYTYGMCGLVAWLFRKLRPSILIPIGLLVIAVGSAISFGMGGAMSFGGEEAAAEVQAGFQPSAEEIAAEVAAYRGSWFKQMSYRVPESFFFETFLFAIWSSWRAGGLMLVGMGLFKLGVFSAKRSNRFYLAMMLIGLGIGLPIVAYGIHWVEAHRDDATAAFFFGSQFNYWGSLLVSSAWMGLVLLAYKSGSFRFLTKPLAAVGQMAFTNYLLHSVICTTIFYGHGLGYFGHVERTGQIIIVIGVWVFQLIVSPLWLKFFRSGPMEWLWRSLTYWKWQPMRRGTAMGSN